MFRFKIKNEYDRTIYLDVSDKALKRLDENFTFGLRIKHRVNLGLDTAITTLLGVDSYGSLWCQIEGEETPRSMSVMSLQTLLEEGRRMDVPSLKEITIKYIKKNPKKIKNVLRDCGPRSDSSSKSFYNLLFDCLLEKDDAPAVFNELILNSQQEALSNKTDNLQFEIDALKKEIQQLKSATTQLKQRHDQGHFTVFKTDGNYKKTLQNLKPSSGDNKIRSRSYSG